MNDDRNIDLPRTLLPANEPEPLTQGMSSLYKLFEAFIALREKNSREHRVFEQSQSRVRDLLLEGFDKFVKETQGAFQNLRQVMTGEKKMAITMLNEMLELAQDLEHIVAAKPAIPESKENEATRRWAEAIEIECRKVQAGLLRHGVHPYDAVIGAPYNPALHERVGSTRVDGMDGLRVAEQREHGWASNTPDFVLRRAKVIITE